MHPELFRLHVLGIERPFYSYGVLMVAAMAAAIGLAVARARRYGVERFDEFAIGMLAIAGGIAGAVLLYFLVHVREVLAAPTAWLRQPGLVFYGGVAGGAFAAWLYCRRWRVSLAAAADAGAPGLALGHAIGRLGCLLGGCCYGKVCAPNFRFAISLHGEYRHPVQAYEAIGLIALSLLLLSLSRPLKYRRGALTALYLGAYAVLRLVTERFRGDDFERGFLWPGVLSTSQAVALAMLLVAILLFMVRRKERLDG